MHSCKQARCVAHSTTGSAWSKSPKQITTAFGCVLTGLSLFALGPVSIQAAITTTGDINPIHDSTDPWEVAAPLIIGDTDTGSLSIDNASIVTSTTGAIGNAAGFEGTVNITDPGSTWAITNSLVVGQFGSGILNIHNNAAVSSTIGVVGYKPGSDGKVTVSGAGSLWDNTSAIALGRSSNGSLRIEDGGVVHNTDAYMSGTEEVISSATITGPGSQWNSSGTLTVGRYGKATMSIEDGGTVNSSIGYVSYSSRSSGTVNVSGSGSLWNADSFIVVGNFSDGYMNIDNGGGVHSYDGYIGTFMGGVGKVDITGAGSTWLVDYMLIVADYATGTLNVRDGAYISSRFGDLGKEEAASATVTIAGTDSQWDVNDILTVGGLGNGELNIMDGGGVSNSHAYIGYSPDSTGAVSVSGMGSTWNCTLFLYVGGRSNAAGGSGEVTVSNNGVVNIGYMLKIWSGGTITLNDGLISTSIFDHTNGGVFNFNGGRLLVHYFYGTLEQNGGTLAPGDSIGYTCIVGDYTISSGAVEIELGGPDNPHDLLNATGNIDIALTDTTLDLLPIGAMAAGTYTVLESTQGTLSGEFEHITGLAEYAGLVDVTYTANAVQITLNRDFLPGDLNADGFVDLNDLDIILLNWNQTVPVADLACGDYSRDGYIGLDDLDAVLLNWNQGTPPADIMQQIPEPGSLALLALGAFGFTNRLFNSRQTRTAAAA